MSTSTLHPAQRVLLGPGPSPVPPRVLEALGKPTLGHLDPQYLAIMDRTSAMLRKVFRTENRLTLPISGTGSAGMEACIVNLVEPGDSVIVCVAGVFGGRMAEVARRAGANVHTLDVAWGETVTTEQVGAALEAHPTTRLVGIVHAETSTGAHQPLEDISRRVHEAGALLLVDAVTSLGGIELRVDDWQIDACYSGTQKCLSCPPGLAPITFSVAAEEKLASRKHPVQSWYFDLSLIQSYWGGQRTYHHTAPINMTYGLHEALAIVLEEGLDARFARHDLNHRALRAGVLALGLDYIPARSLTTLNAITVPTGVDDAQVRARLLADWGIEIGAGLGPFAGKAWRVGLMGEGSCRRSVDLLLSALETLLVEQGAAVDRGAALAAAAGIYN